MAAAAFQCVAMALARGAKNGEAAPLADGFSILAAIPYTNAGWA
jgi:hypothetical protein